MLKLYTSLKKLITHIEDFSQTNKQYVVTNNFQCPICFEESNNAKILVCSHYICKECTKNLLPTKGEYLCPVCRCVMKEGYIDESKNERLTRKFKDDDDVQLVELNKIILVEMLTIENYWTHNQSYLSYIIYFLFSNFSVDEEDTYSELILNYIYNLTGDIVTKLVETLTTIWVISKDENTNLQENEIKELVKMQLCDF
jgi:hypothetical protein